MTRDEVINLALKVGLLVLSPRIDGGLSVGGCTVPQFEQFADLVAKHEREACAAICDRFALRKMHPAECAAAIRAQGES